MKVFTLVCLLALAMLLQVSHARRPHTRKGRDENLEMLYYDLLLKSQRIYTRYCQSFFTETDEVTALEWCRTVSAESYDSVGLNNPSPQQTSVPTEWMARLQEVYLRSKYLEHIADSLVTVGLASVQVNDCIGEDTLLCSMACRPDRTPKERLFSELNMYINSGLTDLVGLIRYRYEIEDHQINYRPISLSVIDQKDVIDKYSLVAMSYLYHQISDIYRILLGNSAHQI